MIPRVSGKCITRLLTDRSDSPAPLLFAPFAATWGSALCVAAGEALSGLDAAMDRLPLDRVRIQVRCGAGKERIVRIGHPVSSRYYRLQAEVLNARGRRVDMAQGHQVLVELLAHLFPEPERRPVTRINLK